MLLCPIFQFVFLCSGKTCLFFLYAAIYSKPFINIPFAYNTTLLTCSPRAHRVSTWVQPGLLEFFSERHSRYFRFLEEEGMYNSCFNQDWYISGAGSPVAVTAVENWALSTVYFLKESSCLSFQTKSGKACRLTFLHSY